MAYEYTAEPSDGGYAQTRVSAPPTCTAGQTIEIEVYVPADSEFGVNNRRHPYRLIAPDCKDDNLDGNCETGGPVQHIIITVQSQCLDSDSDGLSDATEIYLGLNPNDPDTDDDGTWDDDENNDGDSLTNGQEVWYDGDCEYTAVSCSYPDGCSGDTDPAATDTDQDGYNDNVDSAPLEGQILSASGSYGLIYPNWGLVGEVFRQDPYDPGSAGIPLVVQVYGFGGTTPRNVLVRFDASEITNKTPDPGEGAGFCLTPGGCSPASPFYVYTDGSGQAMVYFIFGKKTYGGDPEDDLYGCGGILYAELCGANSQSAIANPGDPDEQSVSFPEPELYTFSLAPLSMTVLMDGFPDGQPWDLYNYGFESTAVLVEDTYGNPVANALVRFSVTEGQGKVMHNLARYCRDNTGDPYDPVCSEDPSAVQTIEIPTPLDTKNHYGPHTCCPDPYDCPPDWNVDAQCDQITWFSDTWGYGVANAVMGPLPPGYEQGDTMGPFPQQITVSLPDYPGVSPLLLSGQAKDIPAGEMSPWLLGLAGRTNPYTQYAGETMTHPFRAVILYRHNETSNPDALPMVRVDDDLLEVDKPQSEFRVGFYVSGGGVSTQPNRTGQELKYLTLPLIDSPSDPTDLAKVFWHLDCQSNLEQTIYMWAIHFTPWITQSASYIPVNFWINPSQGPCVNQRNLIMVDPITLAPISRMPFSPLGFKLKAQAFGGSTAPITVKLVSYDRNQNAIPQDNPPDPEHPEILNIPLTYDSGQGLHLSETLEAVIPGKFLKGDKGPLDSNIPFYADTDLGVTTVQTSGSSLTGASSRLIFTDSSYLNEVIFSQIIDKNGPDEIFLKLELAHQQGEIMPDSRPVPFCLSEPGNDLYCDQSGNFLAVKTSDSGTIAEYRFMISPEAIVSNTVDEVLEFSTLATGDWESARYIFNAMMGNVGYSRAEAVYEMGKMTLGGNSIDCDRPDRPCDGYPDELNQHLIDTAGSRIKANEISETPFLDEYLLQAGGVQVLSSYLIDRFASPSDKVWIQNQADILYYSGHGVDSGAGLRHKSGTSGATRLPIFLKATRE